MLVNITNFPTFRKTFFDGTNSSYNFFRDVWTVDVEEGYFVCTPIIKYSVSEIIWYLWLNVGSCSPALPLTQVPETNSV